MKCECGLLGVCVDPTKWCNCDSGFDDWNYDGGELTQKEHLPVRAVAFGDTGKMHFHEIFVTPKKKFRNFVKKS